MSSIDFFRGHVSSIDFLCLLQILSRTGQFLRDTGHMSSDEICGGHVSSIGFGAIQTKNKWSILIDNMFKVPINNEYHKSCKPRILWTEFDFK